MTISITLTYWHLAAAVLGVAAWALLDAHLDRKRIARESLKYWSDESHFH